MAKSVSQYWPILHRFFDTFGHKSAIFYPIWKFLGSLERRHQALSIKPKKFFSPIFSENSSSIAYNRAIARKNRAIMVKIALLIADNRAIFTRNRRTTFTRVTSTSSPSLTARRTRSRCSISCVKQLRFLLNPCCDSFKILQVSK